MLGYYWHYYTNNKLSIIKVINKVIYDSLTEKMGGLDVIIIFYSIKDIGFI